MLIFVPKTKINRGNIWDLSAIGWKISFLNLSNCPNFKFLWGWQNPTGAELEVEQLGH